MSERSNLAPFLLGGNFLNNCLITFSLLCRKLHKKDTNELSKDGFDWITLKVILKGRKGSNFAVLIRFTNFLKKILITFLYVLHTASWGWYWSTVKRWISLNYSKGYFQGRKVRFSPFSHNYWYYSIVTKCCPTLLHHVASLLWNQSCPKIWNVWNHSKGHFQGQKG